MSGNFFLTDPLPYEFHEKNYTRAMEALGLSDANAEERLKALLEMPGDELVSKIPPSVQNVPAIDGDIVLSAPTQAQAADKDSAVPKGKRWCKDLMIGDAEMDVGITQRELKPS